MEPIDSVCEFLKVVQKNLIVVMAVESSELHVFHIIQFIRSVEPFFPVFDTESNC